MNITDIAMHPVITRLRRDLSNTLVRLEASEKKVAMLINKSASRFDDPDTEMEDVLDGQNEYINILKRNLARQEEDNRELRDQLMASRDTEAEKHIEAVIVERNLAQHEAARLRSSVVNMESMYNDLRSRYASQGKNYRELMERVRILQDRYGWIRDNCMLTFQRGANLHSISHKGMPEAFDSEVDKARRDA